MLVNGSGQNEQSLQRTFHRCFLLSFGTFGKAVSEENIFRNWPIRNKNCLWWPYLLMDRDEMSILLPTMFRFIWPSSFRGEEFLKSANQKQELPVATMLLTDRDEISNLNRGPSIDASYKVSVHLTEGFQRRRLKCEKLTDDRRRMPSDGKNSHCLWQGELKKEWLVWFYNFFVMLMYKNLDCSRQLLSQIILWEKINYIT